MRRLGLLLAVSAALAGCGNANVLSPAEVALNYVSAIAEDNFSGACAQFEAHTRDRLASLSGSSCPRLFSHWRLTSPGRAIVRCVGTLSRDRRRGHPGHPTHG